MIMEDGKSWEGVGGGGRGGDGRVEVGRGLVL